MLAGELSISVLKTPTINLSNSSSVILWVGSAMCFLIRSLGVSFSAFWKGDVMVTGSIWLALIEDVKKEKIRFKNQAR